MKRPISKKIERISDQLDGIAFAGFDQNPKGIRDDLFCLVRKVRVLEDELAKRPELGRDPSHYPAHFTQGDHDCERSPTGCCMYADDEDDCIFCHDPEERK